MQPKKSFSIKQEWLNKMREEKYSTNLIKTKYVNDSKITDHYAIIPKGQGYENYEKLNNLLNNENPAPAAQPAPAAPTQSYNQDNSQEMARPRRYY